MCGLQLESSVERGFQELQTKLYGAAQRKRPLRRQNGQQNPGFWGATGAVAIVNKEGGDCLSWGLSIGSPLFSHGAASC